MLGQVNESLAEARSALKRDPLMPNCRFTLSVCLTFAGRFEEAITETHAGIELDSGSAISYMALGEALAGVGRYDEVVEAFRQMVTVAAGNPQTQALLGWTVGCAGQRKEALTILNDLERRRSESYIGGGLLAEVCLGLGDQDQAISWLQHAVEERDGEMSHLSAMFVFDPLRSDHRFQALLKNMNFPQAAESPS